MPRSAEVHLDDAGMLEAEQDPRRVEKLFHVVTARRSAASGFDDRIRVRFLHERRYDARTNED